MLWEGSIWINITNHPKETLHQCSLCHKFSWRTNGGWQSISLLSAAQILCSFGVISAWNQGALFITTRVLKSWEWPLALGSLRLIVLRYHPPWVCRKPQHRGGGWGRRMWAHSFLGMREAPFGWSRNERGRWALHWQVWWWSREIGLLMLPWCSSSPPDSGVWEHLGYVYLK